MQYQEYKNKLLKITEILRKAWHKRVLICACLAVFFALLMTFLGTKGNVYDVSFGSDSIVYGEEVEITGKTLFSKNVSYEYKSASGGSWSSTVPTEPGEYKARAVGKSGFGKLKYSDEFSFTIAPKPITVYVSDSKIPYGEELSLSGDVVFADKITCSEYEYGDYTKDKTSVIPVLEKIKIVNAVGKDVTSSYVITVEETELVFIEKEITVTVESVTQKYDGGILASQKYEVSKGSVLKGDSIIATFVAEQDGVGSQTNTPTLVIMNKDNLDVTEHYKINLVSGTLTVEKRPIIIHTSGGEWTYDGEEHKNEEYTLDKSTTLADGHTLTLVGSTTVKNAGEVKNLLTFQITDKDGNDVTSNYAINASESVLKVGKRPITISTPSDSWEYDGTEHSAIDAIDKNDSLVSGNTIRIDGDTRMRDAGTKKNEVLVRILNGTSDVTKNYELTYDFGTVTVTKRPVSYLSDSNSRVYTASPYKVESGAVTGGSLASGHKVKPTYTGSQTDVGSSQNKYEMHILDANNKDVTANYDVTAEFGTITVTIREITVMSLSSSHEYDGTDYTYEGYSVVSEYGIIDTHTVKFKEKSSIKNVGTAKNVLRISIFEGNRDKSSNYNITYIDTGVLTVTKRQLSVTANSATKIYDGTPLTEKGYEFGLSGLAPNQRETVTVLGSQTLAIDGANTSANVVTAVTIRDKNNDDVTDNYDVYRYEGVLTVNKRPIEFISADDSKMYDGTPLTNSVVSVQPFDKTSNEIKLTYDVSDYGLAAGEAFETFVTGAQTKALDGDNSSPNYFTATIGNSAEDTTGNYEIYYVYGTLLVKKRPVTYLSGSNSKVYDGSALTEHSFDLSINSPHDVVLDHVAYATYEGSQTNAGKSDNEYSVAIISSNGDETGNYQITLDKGTLTVDKRPIKLVSSGNEKVYDGTPIKNEIYNLHTDSQYDVVYGEIVTPTFEIAIKDVGEDKNRFTVAIEKSNGEPSDDNYEITYEYGDFKITHRPIEISSVTKTKKYDGTPLYDYTPIYLTGAVDMGLAPNQTLVADISTQITFAGTVPNAIGEITITDENGKPVNSNYIIAKTEGTLTVTKRQITFTVVDETKVYDGTPLLPKTVVDGGDKLAEYMIEWSFDIAKDELTYELSGSQTNVGVSDSAVVTYKITHASGEDATDSYELTDSINGKLEITPRYITVTADSDSKVYDDTPLTKPTATVTEGTLAPNQTMHPTIVGSITDAGSVPNVITDIVIKDADGNETTSNYHIVTVDGELRVAKRHVVFLSGSATKPYDGTPLKKETCEVIDISPYNIVTGHNYKATYTGEITLVGQVDNTYSVAIYRGDNELDDVSHNYEIELKTGYLKVTPVKLILVTHSDTKVYDGTPLTCHLYVASEDILPAGHTLTVDVTGSQTIAGSSKNMATWRVDNEHGEDVTTCFYLDTENSQWGTLTVTKKPISISTGSKSKVYDRTPLTNSSWTCPELDEINLAMNHTLSVTVTGTRTLPGISPNTFTHVIYNENGDDVTDSFEVTPWVGNLEVTIAPITVETGSMTQIYTGRPLKYSSADLSDDSVFPDEYSIKYDFTGEITNVTPGGVPNVATIRVYDENNQEITALYEPFVTYSYGTLEITPRDMEITAGSAIKELDGQPLYAPLEIKEPNEDFDYLNRYGDQYVFTWEVTEAAGMLSGLIKEEGESHIVSIKVYLNGEEVPNENFNFTFLPGTLKVVEKIIYVNLYQITGVYDGTKWCFEDGDYWYDQSQFPLSGYYIDIDIAGYGTVDAGTLDLEELKETLLLENKIKVIDPNGNDVTDSFEIMFTDVGGITVTPRKIVIKAGSAQKVYDGKPLETTEYEIVQGSLLQGHEILESPFMISGSQTEVGTNESTVNEYFVTIIDRATGKDVTSCYEIETQNGTLEVKPAN